MVKGNKANKWLPAATVQFVNCHVINFDTN